MKDKSYELTITAYGQQVSFVGVEKNKDCIGLPPHRSVDRDQDATKLGDWMLSQLDAMWSRANTREAS